MLQCVSVCCTVGAVFYMVLQCVEVSVCCIVVQCLTVCCSVWRLVCVALWCRISQCVAAC